MQAIPQTPLSAVKSAVEVGIGKWNAYPAQIWGVSANLDNDRFEHCVEISESVFDGKRMPKAPGPFKRLAAYAVASQYLSPVSWSRDGQALGREEQSYWEPRLAIWSLPFIVQTLRLNSETIDVPITFPTLHSQIETLNHLRNIFSASQGADRIAADELHERITAMSLILETSAYASFPDTDRLKPFVKHAKSCIAQYKLDDPRWPDLFFLNKDFLDNGAGFGLE